MYRCKVKGGWLSCLASGRLVSESKGLSDHTKQGVMLNQSGATTDRKLFLGNAKQSAMQRGNLMKIKDNLIVYMNACMLYT